MWAFLVFIYGIPGLLAAIPGIVGVSQQRRWVGWILIAGAAVMTIPVPIILDRARTRAMTADGLVADDWAATFVLPFVFGILYFVAATLFYVVWLLATKPRHSRGAKTSHG